MCLGRANDSWQTDTKRAAVSTDRLAALLWPDVQPANPDAALHTVVSRLRVGLSRAGLNWSNDHQTTGGGCSGSGGWPIRFQQRAVRSGVRQGLQSQTHRYLSCPLSDHRDRRPDPTVIRPVKCLLHMRFAPAEPIKVTEREIMIRGTSPFGLRR